MATDNGQALSWGKRITYSIGNFGSGVMPYIVASWAMYYYSPPPSDESCLKSYVPIYLIGLMLAIGRVAEALLNPFIGDWSDKTKTRFGRRIPYILFGTPVLALGAILIWFPPIAQESWINAAWVCTMMIIMSCAYAAVVAPYLSLLPELTPHNDERLTVSALMAVFEVLGILSAAAGAGVLIDAYKCGGLNIAGFGLNGFQLAGILFGFAGAICFFITGFGVKEKEYSESKDVTLPFMEGAKEVMKNKAFLPYLVLVTTFRIGLDMVIVAIPYIVTTAMGGEEGDAVAIQLIVLAGAMILFPLVSWLSTKYGKKAVTIWGILGFVVILPVVLFIDKVGFISPMAMGYIIFSLATFPVAVVNVLPRPLLADIIDNDETITGFRREAMFNGMEGLFTRSASGFAWLLASLLFYAFGNSAENPLGILLTGPVASGILLVGAIAFMKYPFKR